jgi:hypothetical protein
MITILFFLSLATLMGMLTLKVFELKLGKTHFLSDLYKKGDERIHKSLEHAVKKYTRYEKIAQIFVFEFLPAYAYELLHHAKEFVARKYYEMGADFRGKRVLKSTGSVSFFLERLSEHKKQ